MSTASTSDASPVPVQPLHNPSQAAKVVVPQAPLGNATNGAAPALGMGARALLAKKMAKNINPAFVSPTDNMMTPCSKKLSAAKKKTFAKGTTKPMPSLFSQAESKESDSSGDEAKKMDDDENPF